MIYGIGTDILAVARIARVHRRHGERFVERVLHPDELAQFRAARNAALYLAKAFAAKEAFVKAVGTGFEGIAHDDVGVVRNTDGKPAFVCSAKLARRLKKLGVTATHLSLSDEAGFVCAFAVLEGTPKKPRGRR